MSPFITCSRERHLCVCLLTGVRLGHSARHDVDGQPWDAVWTKREDREVRDSDRIVVRVMATMMMRECAVKMPLS